MAEYRAAVLSYVSYLTEKETNMDKENLYDLFKVASYKLSSKTRDIALFDILRLASQQSHDSLLIMTDTFMATATAKILMQYVGNGYKIKSEIVALESKDSSRRNSLMSSDMKKSLTWQELVASTKGQLIYVDFWASWCAPCRAEMPNSKKLKCNYIGEKIRFIYVSVDENPSAWQRASKQIGIPDADSYLLTGGYKSPLAKDMKIITIPRYLIIDSEGKLINLDAPRPGDAVTTKILDKLLKF